ncbi:MAG TPA: ABC transporter permease [Nitrospiraceae bacterium]|nr:ABC transporter permease [Nitrospiraceae bacterium]
MLYFTRPSPSAPRPAPFPWPLAPAVIWMLVFFFIPLLLVLAISFASRGIYGGVRWAFTLSNYALIVDPLYLRIYLRSFLLAVATTGLCLVLGFPWAYFIARCPVRWQGVWLLLVIIPFWTNFLVRTYAWMFILRTEGLMNTILMQIGLIESPIEILYTNAAILIGLVYGYLPFMVLPLYAALARLDLSLIEAAQDLYAGGWSVLQRVILPLTRPGIVAGCLLVFIPSVGAFITPDLLGGARTMMVGNLIQHEYLVIRDWPLGSAISFALMALVLAGTLAYIRSGGTLQGLEERR